MARLPQLRLSLVAVLLLIALVAWNLWFIRGICGFNREVSTVTLQALDSDEGALARDLDSAPVLDRALSIMKSGTSPAPRLVNSADAQEQLRRLVTIQKDGRSHTVRLSIVYRRHTWKEAQTIQNALAVSSVVVLGKERVALGLCTLSDEDTLLEWLLVMLLGDGLALALGRYLVSWRNRRQRGEDLGSAAGIM